jgi:luciferase-like monooxygenase
VTRGAGQEVIDAAMAWPGVSSHPHRFGGVELRLGGRQLGHLHGDEIADIPLPRSLRDELVAQGRVRTHRWRPDSGWVTVDLDGEAGRAEAIRLLRVGYDRAQRARRRRGLS